MNSRQPKPALTEWGSTGASVPDLGGVYKLPAGDNGDVDRRELLADAFTTLYSGVGSAQRTQLQQDKQRHAVHQLIAANGALAAGESEALLTLISVGLEEPSAVHLRSLGETVRRMVLCREYPALALELYESAEPSWRKLASTLPIPNAPVFVKGDRDMRALEQTKRFKRAQKDIVTRFHVLNETEWTMWSKRSHGDIYALVQVSQNLRERGEDVRAAINTAPPAGIAANTMLMRGIGFTLMGLGTLISEFSVDTRGRAESIVKRYGDMQTRDRAEGNLRVEIQL